MAKQKKHSKAKLVTVVLKKDYPTSKGIIKAGKKIKTSELGVIELTNKNFI